MASAQVLRGIGQEIERQIFGRALRMLDEAGVDLASAAAKTKTKKLAPKDVRSLFSEAGLRMEFDDAAWPEQLRRLGVRYVPGFDYWGDLQQLVDPKLAKTAENILLENQRVVANLHNNPALQEVLGRPLGVNPETARTWYRRGSDDMREQWGIPLTRSAQLRGRLSGGTAFDVETDAAKALISDPNNMFRAGNMNTELAVDRLLRPEDWLEDPRLWSPQGADAKTYNYAMNYVNPLSPEYVTNDIHQVALSTGLAKAAGASPEPIFANKGLYQMWTRVTKQVADEMGMVPNEAQALMWSIWRDLMSGDVSGVVRSPALKVSKQFQDALNGKPKGMIDAMARSARRTEKEQLAAAELLTPAKKKEAVAAIKNRGDRRVKKAKELAEQYGVKMDPRLSALMLLTGLTAMEAARRNSGESPDTEALRQMGLPEYGY